MSDLEWARFSNDLFNLALFAYLISMVGYFAYMAFRREPIWVASKAVLLAGLLAHAASIASRGVAAHRVPWGNMWEYSSLLAFLVVLAYVAVIEGAFKVRSLGGVALAFSVLTMGIALLGDFYVGPAPLVPALNSYWIKVHVVAAIIGSSLFALGGGVLTCLYLAKDFKERREERAVVPPPIMGGAIDLNDPPDFATGADEPVGLTEQTGRRGLLPPSAVLDRMAYRTIAFAFPIWTFAVIAGAIWAQEAWGRYWGWDPKETWSFITWVIYAGYLHARATSGWKGRRAAVVALVGFVSLLITYYAVNLFIVGLHSYKGF